MPVTPRVAKLRQAGVPAEIFHPPSAEALWLLRSFPDLMSPADGKGSALSRLVRMILVAPNTQLTFGSFELQAFLFDVFHRRGASRAGHAVFMTTCNFFAMLLLARWSLGEGVGWWAPNGAWAYAALLLAWYTAVAATQRLWAWAALMVPILAVMAGGATAIFAALRVPDDHGFLGAPLPPWINPWLGMAVSGFLTGVSHVPEPRLPPRAADPLKWQSVAEFVADEGLSWPGRIGRAVRVLSFLFWGMLDEWWASPRLMAYNYLFMMMRAGYARETYARLRDWSDRALASDNPAVDYVGTGGGTFLRLATGATLVPPAGSMRPPPGSMRPNASSIGALAGSTRPRVDSIAPSGSIPARSSFAPPRGSLVPPGSLAAPRVPSAVQPLSSSVPPRRS